MSTAARDPELRHLRLEAVAAGAVLADAGLVLPGEGNLSVRYGAGLLVTPTGADLGRLRAVDLLEVPLRGETPAGASIETPMHRAVAIRCPRVRAVVHAHPPNVLAFGARGSWPDPTLDQAGRSGVGAVRWVGSYPPGSRELAEAVAEALATAPAAVLYGHGAVAVGSSVREAVLRMLLLERLARLQLSGGPK